MRVFVTGATGWIGSAVVPQLLAAGHEVTGLARSDEAAAALAASGAKVHRGSLDDPGSLRAGAEVSDGVIHLAFKHDFSDYAVAGRTERAAVETIGDTLSGSDRPFLFASGVAFVAPGRVATERDVAPMGGPDSPRGGSEQLALEYAGRAVRSVSLRFAPTVHGEGDRDIAEVIGRHLNVPVTSVAPGDAASHFGWMGAFFGLDMPASSTLTRQTLGWTPACPGLIEDLETGYYLRPLSG